MSGRENNYINSIYVVFGLILIAAFSRIIPHYPNFTPICSIALFGAAYLRNTYTAYLLPLIALFLSDIIINNYILSEFFDGFTLFYKGFFWQYGSFIIITFLGRKLLTHISIKKVLGVSISSSLVFFIISNFGVWVSSSFYSKDIFGLFSTYLVAIPFYFGTLGGSLFYSLALFGMYEIYSKKIIKIHVAK